MHRISALMVTKPGREALAAEAMADFAAQEWSDKELVVVTDGGDAHQRRLQEASDLCGARARIVASPIARTLGALRNLAFAFSSGEYALQWDDDDRYLPDRMRCQHAALLARPDAVCACLRDQLYYFTDERTLYWVDWRRRRPKFQSILIPGTILIKTAMARKIAYPESGREASKGEDGVYLARALAYGPCAEVEEGRCYVRRCHGANTWSKQRFHGNARWLGRSAAELARRRDDLTRALRSLRLPGPVRVMGRDGPAFVAETG